MSTPGNEVGRGVDDGGARSGGARPLGSGTAPDRAAPRRKRHVGAIAVLVVLFAAVLGVRHLLYTRHHVSTDNAQVEGHIIPVLPKVGGYVAEVRVRENQQVQAGDTLVVLDDRDFEVRLEQSQADLAVALASVSDRGRTGQAEAQLAAARAAVTQAEANARKAGSDLERYRTLADRNIVSRQQLDAAEAAAAAAGAQLQAAREQVLAASAGLSGAEARVVAARAAVDQTVLQLSYTHVVAPESGVVSKKNVEVGQLVQAGQPLLSVVPLDDVWVVANLKETQIRNVAPGNKVNVEVDSYPGRRFAGRVESLSPATGAKFSLLPPDNATGNFTKVVQHIPVRIRLDQPQDAQHPLRPGMSVKVRIETP